MIGERKIVASAWFMQYLQPRPIINKSTFLLSFLWAYCTNFCDVIMTCCENCSSDVWCWVVLMEDCVVGFCNRVVRSIGWEYPAVDESAELTGGAGADEAACFWPPIAPCCPPGRPCEVARKSDKEWNYTIKSLHQIIIKGDSVFCLLLNCYFIENPKWAS